MLSLINNIGALTAGNNLNNSNLQLNTALQRLSSGLRINSGADDPAGMVISQIQQAQMSGLQAAISNTAVDTNVAQTADGGLNEINALLVQIRGLAVSAANSGATDSNMLAADQAQIANALQTVTRIATSTQYGKNQLLDGSHAASVGLVGAASGDTATVNASAGIQSGNYTVAVTQDATAATVTAKNLFAGALGASTTKAETLTINGVQVQLASGSTLGQAESAINAATTQSGVAATDDGAGHLILYSTQFGSGHKINVLTSLGGTDQTGVDAATTPTNVDGQNVTASITGTINGQAVNQTVTGTGNVLTSNSGPTAGLSITFAPSTAAATPFETADEVANGAGKTSFTAAVNTNNNLTFQIGANAGQIATLSIESVQANALGMNVTNSSGIINLSQINVASTAQSSSDILNVVDKAINDVSTLAGALGSFQNNTLQATAQNLQTSLQNTTAANSTIRDTNFATESAVYARSQVLVQAGTQVLKNANQLPQLVLALLQ